MPSEAVGMIIFAVISLLAIASLATILSSNSFLVSQTLDAGQNVLSAYGGNALLTAGGFAPGNWHPGVPGEEANGGPLSQPVTLPASYDYQSYTTQTVTYTYQYPVSSQTTYTYTYPQNYQTQYTYYAPQTQTNTGQYVNTYPQSNTYTYTTYTGQGTAWYYRPVTLYETEYDTQPSVQNSYGTYITHWTSYGCYSRYYHCYPYPHTYYYQATCQASFQATTWSSSMGYQSYNQPYYVQEQGSYTAYTDSVSSEPYTYYTSTQTPYTYYIYTSQQEPYSYTIYQSTQAQVPYTYTTSQAETYQYTGYQNTPNKATVTLNYTVIDDGNYTLRQVNYTYTYYTSTQTQETGTYYVPQQQTGYATVEESTPQTVNTYVYGQPQQQAVNTYEYEAQAQTGYYDVWTPSTTTQTYQYTGTEYQIAYAPWYTPQQHVYTETVSYPCVRAGVTYCLGACAPSYGQLDDASVVQERVPVSVPYSRWTSVPYTVYDEPVTHTGTYYTTGYTYTDYTYYSSTATPQTGYYYTTTYIPESGTEYTLQYVNEQGTYLESTPGSSSGTYYLAIQADNYTYWNATITNLGPTPMMVAAVTYNTTDASYTVGLIPGGTPPGTAAWLIGNGWEPEPAWSSWAAWSQGGTQLSNGYTGYNWGGFPFALNAPIQATGNGIILAPGETLAVPYVPGYAVGFVVGGGETWWVY